MTVLSYNKVLTPQEAYTHIKLPFEINEKYNSLIIKFSYEPKTLADKRQAILLVEKGLAKCGEPIEDASGYLPVNNLITISLDSPAGYIGAAHRHANKQVHRISADYADKGFIKTDIITGKWCVVISAHYIASSKVNVALEVCGE